VAAGKWAIISVPFMNMNVADVTMTVNDLLPDAPDDTRAWYYRNGQWQSELRVFDLDQMKSVWQPGTNDFIRGDALFVQMPAGQGAEISIKGEVPGNNNLAPTTTVILAAGWTLVGFSYPVDIALTNTTLNTVAHDDDRLWWYESNSGSWASALRAFDLDKMQSVWTPDNVVLKAGQGYFYQNAGGLLNWNQSKPYSNP
jgi:hypothetical protein